MILQVVQRTSLCFRKCLKNKCGLSKDSIESHLKFTKKYKLEIELISEIFIITNLLGYNLELNL